MYNPFKKKKNKIHAQFINETIGILGQVGLSVADAQLVAQSAELASKGENFIKMLEVIQELVQHIQTHDLHPIDALLVSQITPIVMKASNPSLVIEAAVTIGKKYDSLDLQKNLFSTDMAVMGGKMQETFDKMSMGDIKVEEV